MSLAQSCRVRSVVGGQIMGKTDSLNQHFLHHTANIPGLLMKNAERLRPEKAIFVLIFFTLKTSHEEKSVRESGALHSTTSTFRCN